VKIEDFVIAYRKTKLPHGYKNYLISKMQFLARDSQNVRMFLALVDGVALAG
jgi:hypothetical protein